MDLTRHASSPSVPSVSIFMDMYSTPAVVLRLSNGSYTGGLQVDLKNLKSGGKFPILGIYQGSPKQTIEEGKAFQVSPFPMVNATREGRFNNGLKRYSYLFAYTVGTMTKTSFDSSIKKILNNGTYFIAVLDQKNNTMVRGQCQLELK
eukprot:TRINITY_DN18613_c0_g1_i6.p1 TRINITY_DN18613_c0_g1~~TRINITY_DN18613_c0_g1_i6.p1  ORF type:complete len:148 (+),score=18.30 TRINITY_DN18613_c0_g1_i6:31-474(+)